jgi:hypothetical protein
VEFNE